MTRWPGLHHDPGPRHGQGQPQPGHPRPRAGTLRPHRSVDTIYYLPFTIYNIYYLLSPPSPISHSQLAARLLAASVIMMGTSALCSQIHHRPHIPGQQVLNWWLSLIRCIYLAAVSGIDWLFSLILVASLCALRLRTNLECRLLTLSVENLLFQTCW